MDFIYVLEDVKTLPYQEEGSAKSAMDRESLDIQRENIVTALQIEQKKAPDEILKCRRKNAWEDFISHSKKPWNNHKNTLIITFLKESAIDTGGPKREFYRGIFKI